MKLVIFGLTITSSWGNGHATLWRGLCRALAGRGHSVTFFERNAPYYAAHRDLENPEYASVRLYESWEDVSDAARRELEDAEVGMVTSYCPDGIAASDLLFSSRAGLRVFYDMDTPVTLARVERGDSVPYIAPSGLRDFDLVLSYTGGRALDGLRNVLGARRVEPLYGSVDVQNYRPVPPEERFRADLSYLGTYAEERQTALEELFLEPARQRGDRRFVLGGAQYPRAFPWTDNLYFVHHVRPGDHPAFFSSSRLTLNVTRQSMAGMGFCPSGRLFEATACGTAVLSDRWAGIDQFFSPGEEILLASNSRDAVAALDIGEAERRRIAMAGQERTMAEHTAARRALEFENMVGATAAPNEPAAAISVT